MKKVKAKKPSASGPGIQWRILQKVNVTYSTAGLPAGVCRYQVDANAIPPAGASGIPRATVFVLESGQTRLPLNDVPMTASLTKLDFYSAECFGAAPKSGAKIWAEVTAVWLTQQTEKTVSVIKSVP